MKFMIQKHFMDKVFSFKKSVLLINIMKITYFTGHNLIICKKIGHLLSMFCGTLKKNIRLPSNQKSLTLSQHVLLQCSGDT